MTFLDFLVPDRLSTTNPISGKTVANALLIKKHLETVDYNFAADALMGVAFEMHVHGDAMESKLAELVVEGVSKGLNQSAQDAKRYRKCPHCGRRHP